MLITNPMNKLAPSKLTLWLIAILLLFVLGLIFIWLWYDAKIQDINRQTQQLHSLLIRPQQASFLNPFKDKL